MPVTWTIERAGQEVLRIIKSDLGEAAFRATFDHFLQVIGKAGPTEEQQLPAAIRMLLASTPTPAQKKGDSGEVVALSLIWLSTSRIKTWTLAQFYSTYQEYLGKEGP